MQFAADGAARPVVIRNAVGRFLFLGNPRSHAARSASSRSQSAPPAGTSASRMLASDALSDSVGISLDPASTRGTVAAQVTVNFLVGKNAPEHSATYAIGADLTNFVADKLLFGQKVEAQTLRVAANTAAMSIRERTRGSKA